MNNKTAIPILIVDDRAINREFLMMLLESAGFAMYEAADGAAALAIVRMIKIALVISDVLMPVMDGIEFANCMHADPALSSIPIIFYTATYRETEARMLAQRCGVAMVLGKPAEPAAILAAVANVLGVRLAPVQAVAGSQQYFPALPEFAGLQQRLRAASHAAPTSANARVSTLDSTRTNAFTQGNLQTLSLRMSALLELSLFLALEHDPQRVLDLFCRAAQDIMSAKYAAVGMQEKNPHNSFASCDMSVSDVNAIYAALEIEPEIIGNIFKRSALLNTSNPRTMAFTEKLPPAHPLRRNAILVPIVLRSHPCGWLYVAEKFGSGTFTAEDEQFASTLAAQLAPVYENIVLYDEVRKHAGELEMEVMERRRVSDHLLQSEARFRELAENIHEVFFLIDADTTRTLYISPAYEDIWGRSVDSVYANPQSWSDHIHPEDREQAIHERTSRDSMGRFEFSYRIVRPDGGIRHIRSRGFPIRDGAGNTVRFAGIAEDVTTQVAQSRRIERVSRHYAVLSGVNAAIARIHNRVELFEEICRIAVTLAGFSFVWIGAIDPAEPEGELVASSGAEDDCAGFIKFTIRHDALPGPRLVETTSRKTRPVIMNSVESDPSLDALRAPLLARGYRAMGAWPLIVDTRAVGVISFFADTAGYFDEEKVKLINELVGDLNFGLQYIEKEKTESHLADRLVNTFESLPDAFIMVDCNWNFTYLNAAGERLLSTSRQEVLGTNMWERYPKAIGKKIYRAYHKAMEQSCTVTEEDFSESLGLWLEIKAYPSEGGLAIYLADISARKQVEGEVRRLNERLEARVEEKTKQLSLVMEKIFETEKLASLGGIVAGVAHELNTPIGNIMLSASTLEERLTSLSNAVQEGKVSRRMVVETTHECMDAGNLLLRNARRAGELIESFKKVAVDQTSERRRTFDLRATTIDIANAMTVVMRRANITLENRLPAGILVDSYPGALEQVITNLIMNSINHGFEGKQGGRIVIDGCKRQETVEITFEDDGCGIAPELHRKIFEPFYTTMLGKGGSGLGLFITRNLVRGTLHGNIQLESEPRKGARFCVVFPCVAPTF